MMTSFLIFLIFLFWLMIEMMKSQTQIGILLALIGLGACSESSVQSTQSVPPQKTSAPTSVTKSPFLGSDLSKEFFGGDFTLTDGSGKPFALSSLQGKAVILTFGFTHCPDVCPTELVTYNETMKELGADAQNVAVVFVSIDPDRDTPDLIGRYVKQFHKDFIGLTATGDQNIQAVKQQYRIMSAKTEIQSDKIYNVDHTAGTYLLDKSGKLRVFEPYGSADAKQIAHDVRILLKS